LTSIRRGNLFLKLSDEGSGGGIGSINEFNVPSRGTSAHGGSH
jgi:hypothetical protein